MSNILSANELEPLLTPKDAAHLLGLSTSWLAKCRLRGDGPRYRKVGRAVRYARSDLREYLKARARTSTSER